MFSLWNPASWFAKTPKPEMFSIGINNAQDIVDLIAQADPPAKQVRRTNGEIVFLGKAGSTSLDIVYKQVDRGVESLTVYINGDLHLTAFFGGKCVSDFKWGKLRYSADVLSPEQRKQLRDMLDKIVGLIKK